MLPIIVLIGRTNVGKSTLFNTLTHSKNSLVSKQPNLTRDRQYGTMVLKNNKKIILIDTAGLDNSENKIQQASYKQTIAALKESDLVLFLVNARDGLVPQEYNIACKIRKYQKKSILVINKIDGIKELSQIDEFYLLGFKDNHKVSASNNQGINSLIKKYLIPWIEKNFIKKNINKLNEIEEKKLPRIALIGRPNAGKSTLINSFIKKNRMITSDKPGTTLDSIFIPITYNQKNYIFIDTAGIKKKRKNANLIEKLSIIKSFDSIKKTNITLLIIDSTIQISHQDLSLANFIINTGKSIVILFNKWDLLDNTEKKTLKKLIQNKLKFASFSRIHFISALHQKGIFQIFNSIDEAYKNSEKKLNTSILTETLRSAVKKHQPPIIKGHRIKLKYAHLGSLNPFNVIIHGNQVSCLSITYKRYLIKFFQNKFNLIGTPIRIQFRDNNNPYLSKK